MGQPSTEAQAHFEKLRKQRDEQRDQFARVKNEIEGSQSGKGWLAQGGLGPQQTDPSPFSPRLAERYQDEITDPYLGPFHVARKATLNTEKAPESEGSTSRISGAVKDVLRAEHQDTRQVLIDENRGGIDGLGHFGDARNTPVITGGQQVGIADKDTLKVYNLGEHEKFVTIGTDLHVQRWNEKRYFDKKVFTPIETWKAQKDAQYKKELEDNDEFGKIAKQLEAQLQELKNSE